MEELERARIAASSRGAHEPPVEAFGIDRAHHLGDVCADAEETLRIVALDDGAELLQETWT